MDGRGVIAVVGAGQTGASWAGLFAAHGYAVRLYDVEPDAAWRGLDRARAAGRFLVAKGLVGPRPAEAGLEEMSIAVSLEEALLGSELVQECVPDRLPLKQAVFAEVTRIAPASALVATSSSGLSISLIQKGAHLPGRTLAAHPYNPPHLVPLVELAPGTSTDLNSLERASRLYRSVGREVVVVKGDVPGYVANRLSAALWREAIELVRSGVATVEDIDRAVCLGPGLRWAIMGPHLIYQLGGGRTGIRGHMAHLGGTKEGILRDLADWTSFPADAADVLADGLETEIAGRSLEDLEAMRDEALAALLLALAGC